MYRWNLSKTMFAAGDLSGALAEARALQRIAPHIAGYHRWAADVRQALGDNSGALADLRIALREAPANWGYRWRVFLLDWRLRITGLIGRLDPRRG